MPDSMIDWSSRETHLLLNPRMPVAERERLERIVAGVPALPAHIWLATSGTSGALKLVALSKGALLASAEAVNSHLPAQGKDVWCCVLPAFHVGGLGIYARAFLSDSPVIAFDWDPVRFAGESFTLSALVPAQLRDLVRGGLRPAPSVRGVVIGGGALPDDLYEDALKLGWPVLPSYGMTECSSQIATATLDSPALRILPHMSVRADDGRLAFSGASLLSGYATEEGFIDPKIDGWFISEDQGEIDGDVLRVHGRSGEFVKIGGESVDLLRLDAILEAVRGDRDAAVFAVPDGRLGHVIHLACAGRDADGLAASFNARVLPFERARQIHEVASIPRTSLGKLMRSKLLENLSFRVME
jgi:O-succinylbenzoic acid--CoA ligase